MIIHVYNLSKAIHEISSRYQRIHNSRLKSCELYSFRLLHRCFVVASSLPHRCFVVASSMRRCLVVASCSGSSIFLLSTSNLLS
ncbi:hypothetical protein K432DRAFT_133446 [Lepidopterella palustris CBS 459.81]|uniref:Uncharacterized protein n=1 Tax=Lepidopterella palustris CBS 459.81 TaxID=1314670 RepID=A0A8E2E3V1_9PEZI|nr:hypothetical protein K432DRAFT_133446 [Lepidopterella palustris CBS 459.81]